MSSHEVAEYLQVSYPTVCVWRTTGAGPKFSKLPQRVRSEKGAGATLQYSYLRTDVEEWKREEASIPKVRAAPNNEDRGPEGSWVKDYATKELLSAEWWSLKDVAVYLHEDITRVRHAATVASQYKGMHLIPFVKKDGHWRCKRADVDEWINQGGSLPDKVANQYAAEKPFPTACPEEAFEFRSRFETFCLAVAKLQNKNPSVAHSFIQHVVLDKTLLETARQEVPPVTRERVRQRVVQARELIKASFLRLSLTHTFCGRKRDPVHRRYNDVTGQSHKRLLAAVIKAIKEEKRLAAIVAKKEAVAKKKKKAKEARRLRYVARRREETRKKEQEQRKREDELLRHYPSPRRLRRRPGTRFFYS